MTEKQKAEARLAAEIREIADLEKEPLRRRLLVRLAEGPAAPTALAEGVGARKESVSRKLKELTAAGLVRTMDDADDGRRVIYTLTPAGRSEMGRHLALGAKATPPGQPDLEQVAAFAREAIDGAVAMRRQSNSLEEAIDRFEEIYAQCRENGLDDLALEALAELATTQRQDRRKRQFDQSLKELSAIALGAVAVPAHLVRPANALLEYERGRAGDLWDGKEAERVQRLLGAQALFDSVLKDRTGSERLGWARRRAWSLASLAGVLRSQSRYEAALEYAVLALHGFEEIDDDYGKAYCWFLLGFLFRLLRRFEEAGACLDYAFGIAESDGNRFERLRANSLMQSGDVERCQGQTSEAVARLNEAVDLARPMKMSLTQAFARSAIGAAQFQDGDLEVAQETLAAAQILFLRIGHRGGVALNARRQATVARHLSQSGVTLDTPATKEMIATAHSVYEELNSPTGVAACEIERGWMRFYSPRCGKVGPVARNLERLVKGMLKDPRRKEVLLLDAWLPGILQDFASGMEGEVSDAAPELLAHAKKIQKSAARELQERGEFGVAAINEGAHRIASAHRPQGSKEVIEMGGEPPREREPLLLTPA